MEKIAMYKCASCWGCEDASYSFIKNNKTIFEKVEILFWPLLKDFRKEELEKIKDGEITFTFISGAIVLPEQEENVKILRKKSKFIIAFGTCAHLGGVLGLLNICADTKEKERFIPSQTRFCKNASSLDEVIKVDYYIPGCAPTKDVLEKVFSSLFSEKLPPGGKIFADNKALCYECPLNETKPMEGVKVRSLKQYYDPREIDPGKCFLLQGIICLGPVTRGGCGASCIKGEIKLTSFPKLLLSRVMSLNPKGNIPCSGCFGFMDKINDFGASALSYLASIIDSNNEEEIKQILDKGIINPMGLLYMYSLSKSILFKEPYIDED